MVADGRFRSDLYYRLNVFPITLPPLRERREDIPRLVGHFTQRFARRMGRRIESIPAAIMDAQVSYPWPGNVRELQNVIERAVILSPGPALQVTLGDLSEGMKDEGGRMNREDPVHPSSFILHPSKAVTLAEAEREHILGALRETGWVAAGPKVAAARLGLKRSTLQEKMRKLGFSRPQ
jgi:formate hydrogenlyase transcriptional activator